MQLQVSAIENNIFQIASQIDKFFNQILCNFFKIKFVNFQMFIHIFQQQKTSFDTI